MALAGWCAQCQAWTWVRSDGSCANGHVPAYVTGHYEAGAPADAPGVAGPVAPPRDIVRIAALDAVVLSGFDLAAGVASSGVGPGALAPTLGFAPAGDAAARLAVVDAETAAVLDPVIIALADPARSAYIQVAVADESVSRLVLAWEQDGGRVAVVARHGDVVSVAMREPEAVEALLAGAVGLDGALEPLDVRIPLGATEAIVLVAALDTLRRGRLDSLLTHTAPPTAFTAEQVTATLAAADAEDFRWALQMLDKVAPFRASALPSQASMTRALGDLAKAGLLAITPADSASVALYSLADAGMALYDAWVHEIGRLVMTAQGMRDGRLVRETVLLVRDAQRLWLVGVTDDAGMVACLGAGEARLLLGTLSGTRHPEDG